MSPTHPGMMPAIPPIRNITTGGPRVPLRGPMGRGDYGKFKKIIPNFIMKIKLNILFLTRLMILDIRSKLENI